jgi:hypothetical protein
MMIELLKKLFRPLFYKKIPRNMIITGKVNCRLDFSNSKYDYYTPRFATSWTSMNNYNLSFLTSHGDLTVMQEGLVADEYKDKYREAGTPEKSLRIIYDTLNASKEANISYFSNQCWTGLLAEYFVGEGEDKHRCATVIYAFRSNLFIFSLIIPVMLKDNLYVSEDIYEDILKILKTFTSSKDFMKKWGLPEA